jgi:hypothetical protein
MMLLAQFRASSFNCKSVYSISMCIPLTSVTTSFSRSEPESHSFVLMYSSAESLGYFISMMLSLYFTFVIVDNWKERQVQKIRKWMHIVPIVAGFSLAFAGIPHYQNSIVMCYIAPYPIEEDWTNSLVFAMIPIAFVIVFTTIAMTLVYVKVRTESRTSSKWRFGAVKTNTLPSLRKNCSTSVCSTCFHFTSLGPF